MKNKVTACILMLAFSVFAQAADTTEWSKAKPQSTSTLTRMAYLTNHTDPDQGGTITASRLVEMATKLEAIASDTGSMGHVDLGNAKNKAALENMQVTDSQISTMVKSLHDKFGIRFDESKFSAHVRGISVKEAVDRVISTGISKQLTGMAGELRKEAAQARLIRQTPVFAAVLPVNNILALAYFNLPGPNCGSMRTFADGILLIGLGMNIFGGPETPWAIIGDGFALGGAATLFVADLLCG